MPQRHWLTLAFFVPFLASVYLLTARNDNAKSVQAAEPAKPTAVSDAKLFQEKILPFLKTYCLNCHNDGKNSGEVSFTKFTDQGAAMKDRKLWAAVAEVVKPKEMPPKGKPQPTDAERAIFLDWMENSLTRVDCGLTKDPGRPTIRRLNKAEYNNTIRDLVGVKFQPADDFPSDDVGYGFDNIGDVLTLPPLLLEKYMTAAERILDDAIVSEKPIMSGKDTFRPQNFRSTLFKPTGLTDRFPLLTNGKVFVNFEFLHTGDYTIRARAHGDQAGKDLPKMVMQIDNKAIKTFDVDALKGKGKTYEISHRITAGRHDVELAFTNDFSDKKTMNPDKIDRNLYVELLEIEGPFKPDPVPLPESHKKIMIAKPDAKKDHETAARKIIENFATRAYRRPVKPPEVERLLKIFKLMDDQSEPFEKSIQLALRAVLVSPNFLFRVERDVEPDNPKVVHPINEYELATRLSYFIWSSMPDETLIALAAKGELRKPGVIEAQVKRMLADPKATALTDNFAAQWLNLRIIPTLAPDTNVYPTFDFALKSAMVRETELFFEHIMKEDRSVLEFLDADWTFVNSRLAKHYGITGVSSTEFQKVKLTDRNRGGILTQASVLTLTSNPTRTSPVKRGKWILENILGTPPPPPPPDVPDLEEKQAELKGSLRQRMEQHRTKSICATCHQKMDPLGFGFENFDGIGGWRAMDGKFPIDPSGVLPSGEKFAGPAELRKVLLSKADLFRRNLAEKMLTFALGRGLEYYDKCAIDDIAGNLTKNQDRFSALIIGIVKSDPFQKRRGGSRE
ncbi:MAG: DUF1592 domain-containing protein [Planctomycetes bacterium]|nr:DUF1592 domain-containing protein [Planctomycetota bacterium]